MTSSLVRCPVCGTGQYSLEDVDRTTGVVTCECGHSANAQFVAEAGYLEARLEWVRDRIRAGDVPAQPAPVAVSSPLSAQTILLSVGALLLVIAASVFTAVAWPRLGPAAQLAMVVVVTLVVAVLAVLLRDRLHGTAEALAALAFGLAVVDLAALPALGVGPEGWQDLDSPYWLVGAGVLALAGVLGSRATGLRAWSWLGWAAAAMAVGFVTGLLVGLDEVETEQLVLAVGVLSVAGALLLTGSWVVPVLRTDRRPMVLAGSVALTIGAGVCAIGAVSGDAVEAAALVTALTALVLGGMAWLAGQTAPRGFAWGGVVLALVTGGLLLALLPGNGPVAVLVALLGGAMLLAGIALRTTLVGLPAALVLWATWLVVREPDGVGWFLVTAGLVLLMAAWLGASLTSITWLAWPAAAVEFAGLAVLAPVGYPDLLEAWTLPAAGLLAVAGLVSCRGRPASSLERVGPALTVALLPSAFATWLAPWVVGESGGLGQDVARLVAVLVVGGVLMVLGARSHALGLLLPGSAAVLVAGLAQLWSGLDALPRWVALAIVGSALVLAGARFEWLRDEGRRARDWVHEMA